LDIFGGNAFHSASGIWTRNDVECLSYKKIVQITCKSEAKQAIFGHLIGLIGIELKVEFGFLLVCQA